MKLFIVDKADAERQVCGADNLKVAHQICYKELQLNLTKGVIPICLHADYYNDSGALFRFMKYDPKTEFYYYYLECTTAG